MSTLSYNLSHKQAGMMKNTIIFIGICILALLSHKGYGQSVIFNDKASAFPAEKNLNVESPNYPRFPQYGNTSADLSRGTLSLNIPIYHYQDNDFEIPISLFYSSNGFKANTRTGIVGHGWQLSVAGSITREVQGIPDEEVTTTDRIGYKLALYGFSYLHKSGYKLEQTGFIMNPLSINLGPFEVKCDNSKSYESSADKFHYNFMGYQGSFMLGMNGKIHLYNTNTSSTNIKVEVDFPFITFCMDDGYKYKFEGYETTSHVTKSDQVIYCTWLLTQITAPNNRKAEFKYSKSYRYGSNSSAQMYNALATTFAVTVVDGIMNRGSTSPAPDPDSSRESSRYCIPDYYYHRTCYLENIHVDDLDINFYYSVKKEFSGHRKDNFGNLKKIDRIEVITSGSKEKIKECKFAYVEYPTSLEHDWMIFLDKLHLSGEGEYTMQYNNKTPGLPAMGSYCYDHWGYYNGPNPSAFIPETTQDNLYNETIVGTGRNPNARYSSVGMLKKITYPTGGYTEYEYEANTYSRMVEKRNIGQVNGIYDMIVHKNQDCEAGGVRIKKITDYSDNEKCDERIFSYLNDNNNRSSGLLLHMPRYRMYYECTVRFQGDAPSNTYRLSPSGLVGNAFPIGTHILYSKVREEKGDGSAIVYTFDTFLSDRDITEPVYYQGLTVADKYIKVNVKSDYIDYLLKKIHTNCARLGNLLSKEYLSPADELDKAEYYEYNYTQLPLADTIQIQERSVCGRYISYQYVQNKTLRKKEIWEPGYRSEFTYKYNSRNQLIKEYRRMDDSHYLVTRYSYVNGIAFPDPLEQELIAGNRINVPFETLTSSTPSMDHDFGEKTLLRRKISYKKYGDMVQPYQLLDYRNYQYTPVVEYQYDTQGNVSQKKYKDDNTLCYIWGYGGKYCVAQIKNGNIATIKNLSSMSGLSFPLAGKLTEQQIKELYHMPGCEVEIYEHKPHVGVSKMTDKRRVNVFFEYDSHGRFVSKKDHFGNILEGGKYHVVTETD